MKNKIMLFSVLGLAMIGLLFAGCDVLQENLSDTIAAEEAAKQQAEVDADTSLHSLAISFVQDSDGNVFKDSTGLPTPETQSITVPDEGTEIVANVLDLEDFYNSEVVLVDIEVAEGASVTIAGTDYDPEDPYNLSAVVEIVVTSADGSSTTYTLELVNLVVTKVGIIGNAVGGWDDADELEMQEIEDGVYGLTVEFVADEFLFRLNEDWDFKFGGAIDDLDSDGDNLVIEEAGWYAVTLNVIDATATLTAVEHITLNIDDTPALTGDITLVGQSLFSDVGQQVNFANDADFYTVAQADHAAEGRLTFTLFSDLSAEDWFPAGADIVFKLVDAGTFDMALGTEDENNGIAAEDVVTIDFSDL